MDKQNIIAVDGPAGSGKSSVTKAIAEKFNLNHVDTGAIFRALALKIDESYDELEDDFNDFIDSVKLEYKKIDGNLSLKIDGLELSGKIREHHVSSLASKHSANLMVRNKVEKIEKKIVKESKELCILEGRDIGAFVFPNAILKIYLDASVEVRAKRRMGELNDSKISMSELIEDIRARDEQDMNRVHAPLTKADDAILIDTSDLKFEEVVQKVSDLIKAKGVA